MSCLTVRNNYFVVSSGFQLDIFDGNKHNVINVSPKQTLKEDSICDITLSPDCKYIAIITSVSKELQIFDVDNTINSDPIQVGLPRSASKIKFTGDSQQILIADKCGDALIYNISKDESNVPTKLLGHLSMLLDILQTPDEKFIITCDRDEKIRVSNYPNTYNIQTYCLGHRECVNNLNILPHNKGYLLSTSLDGCIKVWNYQTGKLTLNINTKDDTNDPNLEDSFIKLMDDDGLTVDSLPIVHCSTSQIDENTSFVAVTLHSSNNVFIYKIHTAKEQLTHKLLTQLPLQRFPAGISLEAHALFVYDSVQSSITKYNVENHEVVNSIPVFNGDHQTNDKENQAQNLESIKCLYKRKFDNVEEYQERKKQRLEKSNKN